MDYYSALWAATIILMVPLVYSVKLLITTIKILNNRFNKYTEAMKQQRKTMHAHVGKQWDMENKKRIISDLKLQDKDTITIVQKQLDKDYDKLLSAGEKLFDSSKKGECCVQKTFHMDNMLFCYSHNQLFNHCFCSTRT